MSKWMEGINAEAMDKWMADLRSGEFTQGQGVLHKLSGEMCCLGVATDTNVEACGLERVVRAGFDRYVYLDGGGHQMGSLMPVGVMDYLGIPARYRDYGSYDGAFWVHADTENEAEMVMSQRRPVVDGKQTVSVISLNDTMDLTFPEIADRIESTFKVEEE